MFLPLVWHITLLISYMITINVSLGKLTPRVIIYSENFILYILKPQLDNIYVCHDIMYDCGWWISYSYI